MCIYTVILFIKDRYSFMGHFILLLPDDTIIADLTKPTGSHNIFTFFTFYSIYFLGFKWGIILCNIILYTSRFYPSLSTTVHQNPLLPSILPNLPLTCLSQVSTIQNHQAVIVVSGRRVAYSPGFKSLFLFSFNKELKQIRRGN